MKAIIVNALNKEHRLYSGIIIRHWGSWSVYSSVFGCTVCKAETNVSFSIQTFV